MSSVLAYQAPRDFDRLRVCSGDWILLRPEPVPPDHTAILCRYQGEVIVGIYRATENGPALQLLDADEPALLVKNDDFRVIGAVVGTRKGPAFPDLRQCHAT
jgi:SOS-response transcriptional repressor LexA